MRSFVRPFLGAITAAVLAVVAVPASALRLSPSEYSFQYQEPYFATITARLLKPVGQEPRYILVDGLKGRQQVPLFEGRERLEVAVFPQKKKSRAPLVFVVPGVGGTATDGSALWLGDLYNRAGFHAIVLPSPFFWKFVLSQSRSAVPGFTPEDARDLRRLMVQAKSQAERQFGIRVGRMAIAGYSLGAVDSAFVMKLEREEPLLGLERAVMINPPLHIPYAIEALDKMNGIGDRWTQDQRDGLWGYVTKIGMGVMSRDIRKSDYFVGLDRMLPLKVFHLKFLIGNSFRQTLADTIFLSQQIRDIGLLKVKAYPGRLTPRQNEAAKITFIEYMKKGAWPFWNKRLGQKWTLEEFVAQGDLMAIRELLVRDPAFRLLHNTDDYLTRPSDLDSLAEEMGDRATIYPFGGHMGNMWVGRNQNDLIESVSDLLN